VGSTLSADPEANCTAVLNAIGYTWWDADGPVMDGSKERRDIRVGFADAVPSNWRLGHAPEYVLPDTSLRRLRGSRVDGLPAIAISGRQARLACPRSQHPEHPVGEVPVIPGWTAGIVRLAPRRRNRGRSHRWGRRRRGSYDRCGLWGRLLSARREKRRGNDDDSHRRSTEQSVTGHCLGNSDHPFLLTLSCW
jgi:hypothetical protein